MENIRETQITPNNAVTTACPQASEIKIGKVTYIVTAHFKKDGRETAEDKLFRLVSGRILTELNNPKKAVI